MTRYVFITGGVVSSLGKGITAASLGRLLKSRGLQVVIQKLDPYINVDPGTMNPFQHGEVFVTDDGGETDLDLGHYERFTGEHLRQLSNVTAGSIYLAVIQKERRGAYLGDTVQVIPHITNEIKARIRRLGEESNADVVITEVGGTVGDIESLPFLEAIRQLGKDIGHRNIAYIHVTLAPFLKTSEEMKTKPTQHSVAELRSKGISPDVIVVRSEQDIDEAIRQKISLFCDVPPQAVISAADTDNIYRMPLLLNDEGLDEVICERLSLHTLPPALDRWREMLHRMDSATDPVRVGMVGKYVDLPDAYASVVEALHHAAAAVGQRLEIDWILSENLTGMLVPGVLSDLDGIVVPGGFGGRGIEGKISAISYARRTKVPFLGLCLGLQCAVIEFARNRLKLARANSTEFDANTPHPVIDLMPSQEGVEDKGGTMRLGLYPASLTRGSIVQDLYQSDLVYERHRHRWEVNPRYRKALVEGGMVLSGVSPDGVLVEFIELPTHPFFVGTQGHPEFLSRPDHPHPLFRGFMEKAAARRSQRESAEAAVEVATRRTR